MVAAGSGQQAACKRCFVSCQDGRVGLPAKLGEGSCQSMRGYCDAGDVIVSRLGGTWGAWDRGMGVAATRLAVSGRGRIASCLGILGAE